MDLNPVGGVDPYQGGAQHRPGTGAFARNRKRPGRDGQDDAGEAGDGQVPAEFAVDPLLAEIDRLRALDPDLTESGAHRALKAARAYHRPPDPLDILADAVAAPETPADPPPETPPETPPAPATGSDAPQP